MYNESLSIVMAVEAYLIGEKLNQFKIISFLQRLIWFPLKFLKIGVSEITKGIFTYSWITFAFLFLVFWIVSISGVAKTELATVILLFVEIVPIFLVVFAMPSTYAHSGVDEQSVSFVKQHLYNRGFSTETQIDILKKSLKPIEDRAREKVIALKRLVGLVWAGFVYNSSKIQEITNFTKQEILNQLSIFTAFFIALLPTYIAVWGYEAALDKLFRSIEFGSNDFSLENHLDQINNS